MMKTGNIKYTRLFLTFDSYNFDKTAKYYSIKYKSDSNSQIFSNLIKLEKYKELRVPGVKYTLLLYLRDKSNWKYCKNSGLAFTFFKNVFYGNIPENIKFNEGTQNEITTLNPKYFFFAQLSPCGNNLIVDVFNSFYPVKNGLINKMLKYHNFIYDTILRIQKIAS